MEEWLVKVWDEDVAIDLIVNSLGLGSITSEQIDRAERRAPSRAAKPT